MKYPPPLRIWIPIVVFCFVGLVGLFSSLYERKTEDRRIEDDSTVRIHSLGTKVSAMASFLIEMNSFTGVRREVILASALPGVEHVTVLNPSDVVGFASRQEQVGLPLEKSIAEPYSALLKTVRESGAGRVELSQDRSQIAGAFPFPYVNADAGAEQKSTGVALLVLDLSAAKVAANSATNQRLFYVGIIFLLLGTLLTLVFFRTLTSRVTHLVRTSQQLAAGDLTARAKLDGGDEITDLGRAFDEMADQLEHRDAKLAETEQRFREMAENVEEAFWIYDFTLGAVTLITPAFERIFGFKPSGPAGLNTEWHKAVHPDDQSWVLAEFAKEQTGRGELEYRIIRRDGSVRWLRDRCFPIRDKSGTVTRVAGIVADITARRLAADDKAAFDRKIQETQRLESLGVLAGGIAHDFNNLLTGILGYASLSKMHLSASSEVQPFLTEIETTAAKAADLCKQMLAYSGRGKFIIQLLDLSALVHETTQLLHLSIAKNVVLRFNLGKDLPPIKADPTQLRQVVMNLVINASEALADKSGTISLTSGLIRVDADYLSTTMLVEPLAIGDYVFLEVADNGSGMSAETKARIFEPFFTTKFTGRGLGLSAVLGIVRSHHGAMKVYSEPGKGTTFKLFFPVAEGQAAPVAANADSDSAFRGSGVILVVDDEETVRNVSARLLESMGFTVILANDGLDGLEKYKAHRAEIRVVLMDLTMPHMNGEEAFRQIRAIDQELPILLMSGFNEQEAVDRFTGKGLSGFVEKPFRSDALRAKLQAIGL